VLREEFGFSSWDLHIVSEVADESWPVTPLVAATLARLFKTTPEFWLNLQAAYDARKAGSFDANGSPV